MPKAKEIFLSDYMAPAFLIDTVEMDVDIQSDHAKIATKMEVRRNQKARSKTAPLFLNGEGQKLQSVYVNGKKLTSKEFKLDANGLTIPSLPAIATVSIVSTHNPYRNTELSGFYASGSMLSTQCEAVGFRRITFYPDRPDVMAKFKVTLHADRKRFPVLLANGNLVAEAREDNGRHRATWEDPHPKPCYLFAMVAGRLDKVSDGFTTKSGRKILLEIYVEPGRTKETGFALEALKKSMKWDEDTFGLEYDLDRFMMVATPFFNMGAMENKGLNIFNDVCVLGKPETATDATISFIERVVGHEYFHNWTGDRITCRDWFQLSLKEGLTVFREQEFMGDVNSRAVERLDDVRTLRRAQFAEDAGAMAHAVRPDRYQAIDNFYTATVYEKGAELARMIQTLAGRDGFRKGMELYVKRHDGQAVTCDDFVKAMADANGLDLKQFMLWYSQAGTPVLEVKSDFDAKAKQLRLRVKQSCPPTPGQKAKKPLHIPLAVGLLDKSGRDLIGTRILELRKASHEFTFDGIAERPVVSLLREFSAPVRLLYTQSDDELLFLLANDTDPFNRWEAAQKLLIKYILALAHGKPIPSDIGEKLVRGLGKILRDDRLDAAFKAMVFALPTESELGLALQAKGQLIDVDPLYAARKQILRDIAEALRDDFADVHKGLQGVSAQDTDGISMGKRGLKNLAMAYLAANGDERVLKAAFKQATKSKNMTDRMAALAILGESASPLREKALSVFEGQWKKLPAVMDKWLGVQAAAKRSNVLRDVRRLMKHPAFDLKNPNRVSALIGVFAGNGLNFHASDGSGYAFIADMILKIDPVNPQSAAGLAKTFARWRDFEPKRQKLMLQELKRLAARKNLSPNTREIVTKSLVSGSQKTRRG